MQTLAYVQLCICRKCCALPTYDTHTHTRIVVMSDIALLWNTVNTVTYDSVLRNHAISGLGLNPPQAYQ